MNRSALISDLIFTFLSAWLFTLCVFRYVGVPLFLAVLLSGLCALLFTCALGAFWQSKRKTVLLKHLENALKEKLLLHLSLLSQAGVTKLFLQAFENAQEETIEKQSENCIQTQEKRYYLNFRFAPVTADDVAALARKKTTKRKVLLCAQMEEPAFKLCHQLGIQPQTGEWVFAFLKKHDALPETYLGDEPTEGKYKRRLRLCFAKANAKRFVKSALFILVLSLITPFPFYYLVFGGILLLIALFIRIFGYA